MVSLSNHERTALPPASPELAERLRVRKDFSTIERLWTDT